MLCSTLSLTASNGPGVNDLVGSDSSTPNHPRAPRGSGVAVRSHIVVAPPDDHLNRLATVLGDHVDELHPRRHAGAIHRQDDVASLQSGLLGAFAGNDTQDDGIGVGQHADVADLVPALCDRPHGCGNRLTIPDAPPR